NRSLQLSECGALLREIQPLHVDRSTAACPARRDVGLARGDASHGARPVALLRAKPGGARRRPRLDSLLAIWAIPLGITGEVDRSSVPAIRSRECLPAHSRCFLRGGWGG